MFGIPTGTQGFDLENKIFDVFSNIDVPIDLVKIQACH